MGRHRRLHEHDQFLRRQRRDGPGVWVPLNDEMTDFDFAPPVPRRVRPEPARRRQDPSLQHGSDHRLFEGRPVFAIGAAGGSTIITTVDTDPDQPRRLRDVAAGRIGGASGQPDELKAPPWPSRPSTTARWPATPESVRRTVHRGRPAPSCRLTSTPATPRRSRFSGMAAPSRSPSQFGSVVAARWSCIRRANRHRAGRAAPAAALPAGERHPAAGATVALMRIATWNVNSIKQRVPRLLPWLDQRKPDVVCLQETKLANDALIDPAWRGVCEAGLRGRAQRRGDLERRRDPLARGTRGGGRGDRGRARLPAPRGPCGFGDVRRHPRRVGVRPERPRPRFRPLQVQARVARVPTRRARDRARRDGACAAT